MIREKSFLLKPGLIIIIFIQTTNLLFPITIYLFQPFYFIITQPRLKYGTFNHPFKIKKLSIPNIFFSTKEDSTTTDERMKETKIRFFNRHYSPRIGALLYFSRCTRPDICFTVNELAKFANNSGVNHFMA